MKRLSGHTARISDIVSFEDNSTICTSSYDSKIAIWDMVNNYTCQQILKKPTNHQLENFQKKSQAVSLSYDKNNKALACGYKDGTVAIWKIIYEGGNFHGAKLRTTIISQSGV
jgi:WD40 repeat protein